MRNCEELSELRPGFIKCRHFSVNTHPWTSCIVLVNLKKLKNAGGDEVCNHGYARQFYKKIFISFNIENFDLVVFFLLTRKRNQFKSWICRRIFIHSEVE